MKRPILLALLYIPFAFAENDSIKITGSVAPNVEVNFVSDVVDLENMQEETQAPFVVNTNTDYKVIAPDYIILVNEEGDTVRADITVHKDFSTITITPQATNKDVGSYQGKVTISISAL